MEDYYLPRQSVVNILRAEYSEWIANLTNEEIHAIRKYSFNSYDRSKSKRFFERLNNFLRGGYKGTDKEMLERYGNVISTALKKAPTKHAFICYRRVNYVPIDESYSVGDIIIFDQFISTSVALSKTLSGKYLLIIYVPVNVNGAYIENLSYFPKQREFLLDKGQEYEILSIRGNIIELKIVKETEE